MTLASQLFLHEFLHQLTSVTYKQNNEKVAALDKMERVMDNSIPGIMLPDSGDPAGAAAGHAHV